ncbi:hypothetical protein [Ochrobactrum sp. A-1]|uniref:hypothetical protein n=1 Tax=Ochrobactrum sp. A-1 TaxID=2920940 RepID=UPI001F0B12F7|nr:hypothetical protein [Ochrobactrum sp. A-1]
MADILKINAVEYGGAVAHVAAFRAFEILSDDTSELHASSFDWYGGSRNPEAEETEVLTLAEYTARTASIGEQLWRYGVISGVIVQNDVKAPLFTDLPLARQVAFNTFAATCLGVELEMRKAQLAAEKAAIEAQRSAPAPLALEDSIFEPEPSLGDQHEYQKVFMKELPAYEQQIADARAKAELEAAAEQEIASIGEKITDAPAPLSLGEIEKDETNAEETSAAGSEAGGTAEADPDAQGQIHDLDDDGSTADGQTVSSTSEGTSEDPSELASPLEPEAGEAAGDGNEAVGSGTEPDGASPQQTELSEDAAAATATDANSDAPGGHDGVKPSKSSKTKKQN